MGPEKRVSSTELRQSSATAESSGPSEHACGANESLHNHASLGDEDCRRGDHNAQSLSHVPAPASSDAQSCAVESSVAAVAASPFSQAATTRQVSRKPAATQKEVARLKLSRGTSDGTHKRAASAGGLPRPRPGQSSRQQEKSVSAGRTQRHVQDAVPAANKGLSNKSSTQMPHKVSLRADKAKERGKTVAGIKRTLSLDELQPQLPVPQRSSSGDLGVQPSASKRLLRKLAFGPTNAADKYGAKLPLLAPLERKILASVGQRDWIKVDSQGSASVLRRDKHAVTHELGIQIRDLRLLDPLMTTSYPSCLLCRDKALVVNLEYIKCIITTQYVLILGANQQAVEGFSLRLQKRIREGFERTDESPDTTVLGLVRPSMGGPPFELKALEVALEEVCKHLESLGLDLEISVRPMVGTTTAGKVTSDYLEKLRKIKTRLVRLKTRVETLKEVLEKYLDDEDDMKAVHLSGRLREQKAAAYRRLARRSLREERPSEQHDAETRFFLNQTKLGLDEGERVASEVEMLLEAYYMNLDSTWNKLEDISETLDDAEELMDLEMDTYRNNIIRMKVFLGACHFLAGLLWAIANIFGMNLGLGQDALIKPSHAQFIQVTVVSCGAALLLMAVFTMYLHKYRLAITTITN